MMYTLTAKDFTGPETEMFVENYAWVDERLREIYYGYALTEQNLDEYQYNNLFTYNSFDEEPIMSIKRTRSETDISQYNNEVDRAVKRVKKDPAAIHLLKANPDKIDWDMLSSNPETEGKLKIMLLDDVLEEELKKDAENGREPEDVNKLIANINGLIGKYTYGII
jgi:hypothetical protein